MPSINLVVLRIAGLACDIYYRRSRLGGAVPDRGPVILVGNHPNGLVDPVLLAGTTGRPVRFLSKAPLFDMPVLGRILRGIQALPVYRAIDGADTAQNRATFEAVHRALGAGDVVGLFPEGLTHSQPQLERLKTGAARMALGAEAAAGGRLGVRIVPVGLLFRRKRRFRSRVATWVGEPIDASAFAPPSAGEGVTEDEREAAERQAVLKLTGRIAEGLRAVTLNLDRWEDLPLLELAERIWRPGEGRRVARLRALAEGARALELQRPERLAELREDLAAFGRRLDCVEVAAEDLALRYTPRRVLGFVAHNLFVLLLGLPLAFLGTLLWWLPYRLTPPLARLSDPSPETLATSILLAGLVVFPVWWMACGVGLFFLAGWPLALAGALAAPFLGLFALAYGERRGEARDDLAVFLRLGLRGRLKDRLVRQRDALAARIEALAAELDGAPPRPGPA